MKNLLEYQKRYFSRFFIKKYVFYTAKDLLNGGICDYFVGNTSIWELILNREDGESGINESGMNSRISEKERCQKAPLILE